MGTTDIVAWIGAISGMSAIIWDVYKWYRTGPRLKVTAKCNMETLSPSNGNQTFIVIRVSNTGTAMTTLRTLRLETRKYCWSIRPMRQAIALPHNSGQRLPFELGPGQEWTGAILQDKELANRARTLALYCVVDHSFSTRPAKARLKLN